MQPQTTAMVERGGRKSLVALALALVLCTAHFASFDIASQPIATDVRYFLYFAWRISQGATPHGDYFDPKTQLASFAGAGLFRLGAALGLDPLLAIRAGYLTFAGAGGLLAFAVHRRLALGNASAGLLGALAYCSFGFIGSLAAVGNVPKLLLALCAPAAAWACFARAWLAAGILGALAFMDWQVGAIVWLAAFGTALFCARPALPAALRVALGGALGIAPFAWFYTIRGALSQTFQQTIAAAAYSDPGRVDTLGDRLGRIAANVQENCAEQQWLFWASLLGLPIACRAFLALRGRDELRLLAPLCVFHVAVIAFSLLDFQGKGDLFLLVHGAAFFLALLANAARSAVLERLPREGAARPVATACIALLALALARPSFLRPRLWLSSPQMLPGATLDDQREVAAALATEIGSARFLALEHSELLFLMQRANLLPLIYWNPAAHSAFREPGESEAQTLERLIQTASPDRMILFPGPGTPDDSVPGRRIVSQSGKYGVLLLKGP